MFVFVTNVFETGFKKAPKQERCMELYLRSCEATRQGTEVIHEALTQEEELAKKKAFENDVMHECRDVVKHALLKKGYPLHQKTSRLSWTN